MTEQDLLELRIEMLNDNENKELNRLAYIWARHCEINWYHATSDLEGIAKELGFDNMVEYVNRRLIGEKISLNDFTKSKGLFINWSVIL
jgi:hypothetical protein